MIPLKKSCEILFLENNLFSGRHFSAWNLAFFTKVLHWLRSFAIRLQFPGLHHLLWFSSELSSSSPVRGFRGYHFRCTVIWYFSICSTNRSLWDVLNLTMHSVFNWILDRMANFLVFYVECLLIVFLRLDLSTAYVTVGTRLFCIITNLLLLLGIFDPTSILLA